MPPMYSSRRLNETSAPLSFRKLHSSGRSVVMPTISTGCSQDPSANAGSQPASASRDAR
jgi:O-acetyl-ADP-ribose deacetylase (regulator of RNase III)